MQGTLSVRLQYKARLVQLHTHSLERMGKGGDHFMLDTSEFPDGYYDLRLRAINDAGIYNETYARHIEIRNKYPPTPTPYADEFGVLVTSPLESPLPTPTVTPDIRARIPGAQGFYAPDEHATLYGYVPIDATVNNLGFQFFERYELFISGAGQEVWSLLISSEEQHWRDTIFVLNTTQFADGYYDLRLRIVYEDSNYSEYHLRNLRIANKDYAGDAGAANRAPMNGIYHPRAGEQVSGVVDFVGTVVDPDFLRWELYWSPSGKEAWSFLVSDQESAVGALLARLDLSQLPAGYYDFRLRLVRKDYNYDEYFVHRVHLAVWGD